ncbi:hypothetical protein P3W45_001562 [Vairimorpha bombi]
MSEIESSIQRLRNQNVDSNIEDYTSLIEMCDNYTKKYKIFRLLKSNTTNISSSLPLIFLLTSKLKSVYEDELVLEILDYFKNIKSTHEYEWISKIIFLILEYVKDRKKNNEIKLLVLENIKICSAHTSIINHIYNFMLNDNSSEIVYAILVFIPEICDDFVREAISQTNPVILKNCGTILVNLCSTQRNLFVNYRHFDVFLDSEHYFLRNCYLEIIFNMVEVYKEMEDIQGINNIINVLKERLNDVYFNVRYRALSLLGSLFENNSVPLDTRNELIKCIGERILDKTVIVRKKAATICNNLLINNPFISEDNLSKKDSMDDTRIKYYEDMNNFHDVMKIILSNVMTLLNTSPSSDSQVFLDFIKLCLYYEIDGSKECFEQTFDLVWENDCIISCFKDIITRVRVRKISVVSFLKKFVSRQRNHSFEKIVRELYKRSVLNIYEDLHEDILKNKDIFESSYLLFCIGKYLENDKFYELLRHVTNILFSVSTNQELDCALQIYSNILNLKAKKKESEESEILNLVIKNLSKMVFFDFRTVQDSVNLVYKIAKEPEIYVRKMLVLMNNKNLNLLKLIYSDIKERRKSINASRMSFQSFVEEDEDRANKLKKEDVEENFMDNKTEEEISDFFFYLKEKDVLYNKEGLLYEYSRMIPDFCKSEDKDLQEVSFLSLCKLMCLSSEYFMEHKDLFLDSFTNVNDNIRANAAISMGDYLLSFNSIIENNSKLLFEGLSDGNTTVRKNSLLTIYSLLKRNILRLGSNSIYLTNLIFDEDEEIRNITRNIIFNLSENDNFITTIVYEKFSNSANDYTKFVDFFMPLLKDKSKETIFLKLLRTSIDKEVLKFMFNKFAFNEKFVEDMKHIEEFKGLEIPN